MRRLAILAFICAALARAQFSPPSGGGTGVGAANVTATCAGTVTSCAVTVTTLGLTSSTSNTAIAKCYVSSTGAELTITSSAWSGGPPYTTFTPNFTSNTGVYCTVNSNGGKGATGATGPAGATGPTGTLGTSGSVLLKGNGAGGVTNAVVGDSPSIAVVCTDTSGSTSAYTCNGSPVPTTYSNMAGFFLTPQTNGAGGSMTVNISNLGNIALYDQTCSNTLTSSSLVAGSTYWLGYIGGKGCLASGAGGGSSSSSAANLTPSFNAGGTTTCAWASAGGGICTFTMSGGNTTIANTGQVAGNVYTFNITNDSTPRTLAYQANMSSGAAMPASAGAQIQFQCYWNGTTNQCGPAIWLNGARMIGPTPEDAAPTTTVCAAGLGCFYFDSTDHAPEAIENGSSNRWKMFLSGQDANPITGQVTNLSHVTNNSLPHSGIAATAVTPGSYTTANITVAADGTLTAASNGTAVGCIILGNSGDFFMPGVAAALDAYPSATNNTQAFSPSAGNYLVATKVYVPCAWTPNNLSIYITTAGSSTCKYSVGVYNASGTLIINSGVMTNVTTVPCSSTGVKTFTSGTSPAATGLGTQYPAGFYWLATTGNESTGSLVCSPVTSPHTLLVNAVATQMGYYSGTSNGVLPSTLPAITATGQYIPQIGFTN